MAYLYDITSSDKELLKTRTGVLYCKITIPNLLDDTDNPIVLTENDSIKSWELENDRYVPNNGIIGQFVSKQLSGVLQNISSQFNIENEKIKLSIGIKNLNDMYIQSDDYNSITDNDFEAITTRNISELSINWYDMGTYIVEKPSDDEVKDNTKFDASDLTVLFNIDFDSEYTSDNFTNSFDYLINDGQSVTLLWLAKYVCEQVGVVFGQTSFTNSTITINTNQFQNGESCREVMKNIAKTAIGYVEIDWDDKCYIREINTNYTNIDSYNILTNNEYWSLSTMKEAFGPVNKVSMGMSDIDGESAIIKDDESILENGLTEIRLDDNIILYTESLRLSAISAGSNLFGFKYIPIDENEITGQVWFKANQPIIIKNMENVSYTTYPFNIDISYNGGIKVTIETPALTEVEESTGFTENNYKNLRNVKIEVDKANGVISEINSKIENVSSDVDKQKTYLENTTNDLIDRINTVETNVTKTTTDTYTKTEINEIINGIAKDGTSVSLVKTTSGTFDNNGLTIEQTDADTKTNINANGMIIQDTSGSSSEDLLVVNSNGMVARNVSVSTYLTVGTHSRFEDYDDGTGVFYIGGGY